MKYLLIAVAMILVSCSNPAAPRQYADVVIWTNNPSSFRVEIGQWAQPMGGENHKLIDFFQNDTVDIIVPVGSFLYSEVFVCDTCHGAYNAELRVQKNQKYYWQIP